jgi:hypothetical protein
MQRRYLSVNKLLCLLLLGLVAAVPVFAGSAVIGSVAGSMNATVGGQTLLPNTTLFSGDSLQVKDGVAVVALGNSGRLVLGRDTVASFLRDSNEVTLLLGQGNVSVFHAANTAPVRVRVGDVSVVPVGGFKTLGEVAMLNGAVVVTSKEGTLRVEGRGPAINVARGKTITVYSKAAAPPQGGAAGGAAGSGVMWGVTSTALSGGSLVVSALSLVRAGDAKNSADIAASNASAAESAASSAGNAASSTANQIGCAVDTLAGDQGYSSPYTPTSPCPAAN